MASLVLAIPAAAQAAETYELRPYGTKCVSGQTDERQFTYTICHDAKKENYLRVDDAAGVRVAYLRMPGANDVAPAPDGAYVYVSGGGTTPLRKFVRTALGAYEQDYAWKPPTFRFDGAVHPTTGRQIATDAYGNLYVANGMWTDPDLTHVVTKFAPDGRLLALFGGFSNTWGTNGFFSLGGVAVSRDGRYVYVTEVHNSRVQRFDRQADGSYRFSKVWGNSQAVDPGRVGLCVPTMLAAPYDIAVDGWGDVWTTSTTCTYVQKFTKDGIFVFGSFVGNKGAREAGMINGEHERSHNIATDGQGNVIAGENSNWLVRVGDARAWPTTPGADVVPPANVDPVAPAPAPAGDVVAPVLRTVTVPATTPTSAITVALDATDAVGVTQVRLCDDFCNAWTAWQPYAGTVQFTLRAGNGNRGVYVNVRDAAGNESANVYRTTLVAPGAPAPVVPAPVVPAPVVPAPVVPAPVVPAPVVPAPVVPAPVVPAPVVPAPVVPGPDVTAPVIGAATIPATTAASAVTVTLAATDAVGVTQVRMCDDWCDAWTPWVAYAPNLPFTLRAGTGFRGVHLQVRDAAGNESTVAYRTTRVTG